MSSSKSVAVKSPDVKRATQRIPLPRRSLLGPLEDVREDASVSCAHSSKLAASPRVPSLAVFRNADGNAVILEKAWTHTLFG